MTLLNHLFGNKKSIAKELVIDDNQRIKLWEEHLSNYDLREKLCKHFSFANIDKALQDFEATKKVLEQIESLISPELIHINEEEKTDEEIIEDLNQLKSVDDIDRINDTVVAMKEKGTEILNLFQEIHDVLKTELHLIKLIKRNPSKDLLLKLFKIIFNKEAMLYKTFREQTFQDKSKHIHANIVKIARAVILQEEINEEMEKSVDKFARELLNEMHSEESEHRYRKLGEDIFIELAEMTREAMKEKADILDFIRNIEEFMDNERLMYTIVKKFRPRYDDIKIKGVAFAFRQAYESLHFEDLQYDYFRSNIE